MSQWRRNSAGTSKKNVVMAGTIKIPPAGAIHPPPPRKVGTVASTVGTIGSVASLHEYGTRENNYFRTQDNNDTQTEYV